MSNDSFSEISHQSWFSRLGGAFKGILFGLLLFVVSFPLLFWNEGRAVKTYKTLKEGGGRVIPVQSVSVDPAQEGKLVHISGRAETEDTLEDSEFGVSAQALKLKRITEMYQWKESVEEKTKKKIGGGTETVKTYNYNKAWSGNLISSSKFRKPEGHQNPGQMPYQSRQWKAEPVTLGAYRLSPALVDKVNQSTPLRVNEGGLPEALSDKISVHDGGYYMGDNPASPALGDVRISFTTTQPMDVSIIARQVKDTFEPYQAKAGGTIELLQSGIHSADAMIEKAQADNRNLTWILRGVGFIVMGLGLSLVFKPLSVLADVLPFLGSLVGFGTFFIAMLAAGTLSLVTIALAWIVYRPVLGISLLVIATVGLVVMVRWMKQRQTQLR